MGAWLAVALRRAAHDAALISAAALVVLVAAGVLVAAAVYPAAVVRAGIVRTMTAADPVEAGVSVTIEAKKADVAAFDATVRDVVGGALGPASGTVALTGLSESYSLASGATTRFAFADGLDSHARLVRGRWPAGTGADLEATVNEPAAANLGVDAGTTVQVRSRLDPSLQFTVRIVGVFAVDDPLDQFWGGDQFLLTGIQRVASFTTVGPLFIGRDDLLGRTVVTRTTLAWRATPAFERLAPDNLAGIAGNVGALGDRLAGALGRGQAIVVRTELPRLLGEVGGRLSQADAGSTLVAGQMVVLAMYALIFLAALVVGQRRAGTGLLRARGAASRHLMGLALIEAVVVAVPTAALGIPLGLGLATLLVSAGPTSLAGGGASGQAAIAAAGAVSLTQPVVLLATVAALVAIVGLAIPTALAVGPLARVHRSPGRQRAAALVQRSRIDLALAGLGAIALWRLREPSGGSAEPGATPLAAAGPAIGLLAGAILLLRIVPLVGRGIERGLVRGRSSAAAFSARSVARRAPAFGRPALLFAMSAAIGLFGVGYARSWEQSQRDQAGHAVGAGIRGAVGPGSHSSGWDALAAYRAIPGVVEATPVVHEDFATGPALQHGMLLAVAPEGIRSIAAFRPDLASRPFADLMADLIAARPDPPTLALPAGVQRVRLRADLRLEPTGSTAHLPAGWAGLAMDIVVRDAGGLLHRVALDAGSSAPPRTPSRCGSPIRRSGRVRRRRRSSRSSCGWRCRAVRS